MFYTYLLGWTKQNKYYYGVRYAKHAAIEDIGTTYFSSSKYVKLHIEQHGKPDIIQIRKIHITREKALEWEKKVLRRMSAVDNPKFLNRWDNNMVPLNTEGPFPFEFLETQKKIDAKLRIKYGERGSASAEIKKRVYETNELKYGTYHTLNLDHVKSAREHGSLEKYGTTNPFYSPKFQESLINPMHDNEIRKRHKKIMAEFDWSERNEKSKKTIQEKYGGCHPINSPEVREKNSRYCPICSDEKKHNSGNFSKHMKSKHQWSQQDIKRYKDAHTDAN